MAGPGGLGTLTTSPTHTAAGDRCPGPVSRGHTSMAAGSSATSPGPGRNRCALRPVLVGWRTRPLRHTLGDLGLATKIHALAGERTQCWGSRAASLVTPVQTPVHGQVLLHLPNTFLQELKYLPPAPEG